MSNVLSDLYKQLLITIGEDPNREGLSKTHERAARAMAFLTKGYHEDLGEIVNNAIFQSNMDEMIIVKDIELYSLCEHHLLPFIGKCHVAYLPQGKIIGLSKIARVVNHFARRLQVQEHLTQQIAECIRDITNAAGVGVIIQARHLCMMMRGVEKQHSEMTTSMMLGVMRDEMRCRMEFLNLVQLKN